MTPLGMKLLDAYYKIIHYRKRCGARCNLTDRDIFILNELVDFESQIFRKTEEVAAKLGLTSERVRQLYRRALNRIAMASTKSKGQSSAPLIRSIIESKGHPHGGSIHMGIIMLWMEDLSEYSDKIIIPFLSGLCHTCKDDREETKIVYKKWKERIRKEKLSAWRSARESEKRELRFEYLLQRVIWFDKIKIWNRSSFDTRKPQRQIKIDPRYNSGEYWSDKCQRHVGYESGLELLFIHFLELCPKVDYYLEQPVTLSYTRHKIKREYTPDFIVRLLTGECILVEVKNYEGMVDARVHRRMEALIEYCETHGFGLLLTNGTHSVDRIRNYPYRTEIEAGLLELFENRDNRTIWLHEFKALMTKLNAKKIEFWAIVLKNNWAYYPMPFRLSRYTPYTTFRKFFLDRLP